MTDLDEILISSLDTSIEEDILKYISDQTTCSCFLVKKNIATN